MNKSWAARNSRAACQQKTLHLRSQRTGQLPETQAENVAFHMKNTLSRRPASLLFAFSLFLLTAALLAWGADALRKQQGFKQPGLTTGGLGKGHVGAGCLGTQCFDKTT